MPVASRYPVSYAPPNREFLFQLEPDTVIATVAADALLTLAAQRRDTEQQVRMRPAEELGAGTGTRSTSKSACGFKASWS